MGDSRLGRMTDIVTLLGRHVRPSLIEAAVLERELAPDTDDVGDPDRFARDLEAMGPTFVKFGQMLSTRPDLLPPHFLEPLARLQDDVDPVDADTVRSTIETELGMAVSDAFAEFDDEPIASASLAQVHAARLANGRAVVVKVKRPELSSTIRADLRALASLASATESISDTGRRFAVGALVDDFRSTLVAELDFRNEADNLDAFAQYLEGYDLLRCPAPVHELTTRHVLTMDRIDGRKVTDLSDLSVTDIDGEPAAEQLLRATLDQILVHGLLHADPHPGNLLWSDGGLVLLDLGMVARLSHRIRVRVLDLVLGLAEGRADWIVETACEIGTPLEGFDRAGFERSVADIIGRFETSSTERLDAGAVVMELTRAANAAGIRPPVELMSVGKALLNLDAVVAKLAPQLRPRDVIADHVGHLVKEEIEEGASPIRAARVGLASARMAEDLPDQVRRILRDLGAGELTVKVEAFDQDEMLRGLEKLATRVAAGIVVAAMLVGAALALRVESTWTWFGQPAIALVFFVLGALLGLGLAGHVLIGDWHDRRRRRGQR